MGELLGAMGAWGKGMGSGERERIYGEKDTRGLDVLGGVLVDADKTSIS